jgi:hypothetical protein
MRWIRYLRVARIHRISPILHVFPGAAHQQIPRLPRFPLVTLGSRLQRAQIATHGKAKGPKWENASQSRRLAIEATIGL